MYKLITHFLPSLVQPIEMTNAQVVVIDILRATTTITQALGAGAMQVIPCLEVEEAQQKAANFKAGEFVLGGERDGVRIPGFDLGNSPKEYTPETVGGHTVLFTTTNGTRAMDRCRLAKNVWIGAFVNISSMWQTLLDVESDIHLVCAGTKGEITREDVLYAGALVQLLLLGNTEWTLNDQSLLALAAYREIAGGKPPLAEELQNTQGGRNLHRLGLAADLLDVAQVDRWKIVPQLDLATWTITPVSIPRPTS